MKFVNSLKYLSSFECGCEGEGTSVRRLAALCNSLGKINSGAKFIYIPGTPSGHGVTVLCESILRQAGRRVGVVREIYDVNTSVSPRSVSINGKALTVGDVNSSVSAVRSAVGKGNLQGYKREEIIFALSLLNCRTYGCEYIIIESDPRLQTGFESICKSCEVAVIPPVYNSTNDRSAVMGWDAIRHGAKAVVCGVMDAKCEIYSRTRAECVAMGAKLSEAVGKQLTFLQSTLRQTSFSYKKNSGYTVKSASLMLCDCAITAIEVINALKSSGLSVRQGDVNAGIANATGSGCFEVLSVYPTVIADSSENAEEARLLSDSLKRVIAKSENGRLVLCICAQSGEALMTLASQFDADEICVLSDTAVLPNDGKYRRFEDYDSLCNYIISIKDGESTVLCFGGVEFSSVLSAKILRSLREHP